MSNKTILIVGNIFSNFADMNSMVITLDEFKQFTKSIPLSSFNIHIGQGLSSKEVKEIEFVIFESNYKDSFILENSSQLDFQEDIAHQTSVHKEKPANVLISPPINLGLHEFISSVHLQSDCAELNDHMTGQHVQGMVLIEAARQMMLSVNENYLLSPALKNNAYFVLHDINVEFKNFMFPINSEIKLSVFDVTEKKGGTIQANTKSIFSYDGIELATISISYSAYPQSFIAKREAKLASDSCDSFAIFSEGLNAKKYG